MKTSRPACSQVDTLILTLADGRVTVLSLHYSDEFSEDACLDAPDRLIGTMFDAFWAELMEQE